MGRVTAGGVYRVDYAGGTFLESRNSGWGGFCAGAALCSDGRVRRLKRIAAFADTWFSVPAAVTVSGRTVTGFVSVDSLGRFEGPAVVWFVANRYGVNGHLLPGIKAGGEVVT